MIVRHVSATHADTLVSGRTSGSPDTSSGSEPVTTHPLRRGSKGLIRKTTFRLAKMQVNNGGCTNAVGQTHGRMSRAGTARSGTRFHLVAKSRSPPTDCGTSAWRTKRNPDPPSIIHRHRGGGITSRCERRGYAGRTILPPAPSRGVFQSNRGFRMRAERCRQQATRLWPPAPRRGRTQVGRCLGE